MTSADSERYLSLKLPRKLAIVLLFILLFLIPALSYAGAKPLESPDYWIGKLGNPDAVVLTPAQVRLFNNATVESMDQMADLESMPDYISGERVFEWAWSEMLMDPGKKYGADNRRLPKDFFDAVVWNMALDAIGAEAEPRFAVVVERADMRGLPTAVKVRSRPGGFDSLQYSSLYPGDRVVLVHESRDGQWGFFQARALRGWLRMEAVAFGGRDELLSDGPYGFLVVTGSRVTAYSDMALKRPVTEVAMGGTLSLAGPALPGAPWPVRLPSRDGSGALSWTEAYLGPGADVSQGFLPYTRRNVIRQAFKMLGEEYGWGGRDGLRDCSLFIQDVFATVGLALPRNSRHQGESGNVKAHMDLSGDRGGLSEALRGSDPGITLLTLNGHVMLYLGKVKGKPYVIHQIFGYAARKGMRRIGRAAVTGLDLGSRSATGPMSGRLRSVTEVTVPAGYMPEINLDNEI